MDFEQAHKAFLDRHLSCRSGERKGRLLRGHNYAEKLLLKHVWWPVFGTLDHLHPEYEVYDYALNRDTFLTGMGWKMIHFSFDDVQNRPEVCRMLLQLVIGPDLIRNSSVRPIASDEKDVLHLAWKLGRPIRPKDVSDYFEINFRTARNRFRSLVEKGLLHPVIRGGNVRYYEIREGQLEQLL